MASGFKLVIFKLQNQIFGIDINLVHSIEKKIDVVHVPNSIPYIKGIINLRGDVIPVYSLRKKFGMENQNAYTNEDESIIIKTKDICIALAVDEVLEIHNLEETDLLPMPNMVKTEVTEYLDKVTNIEGKLAIILDVNKLLSATEVKDVVKLTEELQQ
jgi:purine-binding chemotaxis protein CheW